MSQDEVVVALATDAQPASALLWVRELQKLLARVTASRRLGRRA
jgi:hypothetical protein